MSPALQWLTGTWRRYAMISKIVSFGMIGIANAAIDFAVFFLAYRGLEWPIVAANVMAWVVAVSCSYVMNTMITFRAESGRVLRLKDYASFAACGVFGLIANTAALLLLSKAMPVYAAKLGAILVAFVVNFSMTNFVVFRATPHRQRP